MDKYDELLEKYKELHSEYEELSAKYTTVLNDNVALVQALKKLKEPQQEEIKPKEEKKIEFKRGVIIPFERGE